MPADANRGSLTFSPRQRVVAPGGTRHGVVIGIERYRDERLNLRCARADACAVYELMIDPACGLFPAENVQLLLDEAATTQAVRKALSRLRKQVGEHDTV